MRDDDYLFVSSVSGSLILPTLMLAALYVGGPEPLTVSAKSGAESFNPHFLFWLLLLIPIGSCAFLAHNAATSFRKNPVPALTNLCLGSLAGGIAFYYLLSLLIYLHPLFVTGLGLAFSGLLLWLAHRNAVSKSQTKCSRDA